MLKKLLLCCLLISYVSFADKLSLQRWDSTCMNQLKQKHQQQAFLLVLWSLDCPACFEEFEVLKHWKNKHPDSTLVLISTDSNNRQEEVINVLNEYSLNQADVWIFSDENKAKLRNSIDKTWFGELPRSYFFTAQQQTIAHSGALTKKQLEQWQQLISIEEANRNKHSNTR